MSDKQEGVVSEVDVGVEVEVEAEEELDSTIQKKMIQMKRDHLLGSALSTEVDHVPVYICHKGQQQLFSKLDLDGTFYYFWLLAYSGTLCKFSQTWF